MLIKQFFKELCYQLTYYDSEKISYNEVDILARKLLKILSKIFSLEGKA